MKNVILNERLYAEKVLSELDLGDTPVETLTVVAKYYFSKEYSQDKILDLLKDLLLRCDSRVNLNDWHDTLSRIIGYAKKYPLIELDYIVVTRAELEVIDNIQSRLLQRLMFTLLCLAKYGNAINPNNKNWVNKDVKDIFEMANIVISYQRKGLLINNLHEQDLVKFSKSVSNTNLNVQIVDDSSEPVLYIDDFRNLGYQYLLYRGEQYVKCKRCGLTVKRGNNRQMYCTQCAMEMNREAGKLNAGNIV